MWTHGANLAKLPLPYARMHIHDADNTSLPHVLSEHYLPEGQPCRETWSCKKSTQVCPLNFVESSPNGFRAICWEDNYIVIRAWSETNSQTPVKISFSHFPSNPSSESETMTDCSDMPVIKQWQIKSLMQGRFPYFIHEFEPCRTIRTASWRHGVFRTARQTSHGIRHLSLKVKLSHSLRKLVSATFSVLNIGPLRSYKARSFLNRLLRRGTDPTHRLCVTSDLDRRTAHALWPPPCRSRPIDRDVDASAPANFEQP